MAAILRKYNNATTILFPLVTAGAQDFTTGAGPGTGDTQISKDEGAFANTTNNPAHEGNGIYSLALTATEMSAGRIAITCIDTGSIKDWEDQAILIETYGHASAQHKFDLDTATQDVNVAQINGSTGAATNAQYVYGLAITTGAVSDASPAAGDFDTDLGDAQDWHDQAIIVFRTGALTGQARVISSYSSLNGNIKTFTNFTSAPSNGDNFIILGMTL